MEKEKNVLELFELEELIKITTDKKEQKRLKERFRRLTKKLEKEEL